MTEVEQLPQESVGQNYDVAMMLSACSRTRHAIQG